jgi:hypothetical protein
MNNIIIEEHIDDGGLEGTMVHYIGSHDGKERRAFFSGEAHLEIAQMYTEYLEDILGKTAEAVIRTSFDNSSI